MAAEIGSFIKTVFLNTHKTKSGTVMLWSGLPTTTEASETLKWVSIFSYLLQITVMNRHGSGVLTQRFSTLSSRISKGKESMWKSGIIYLSIVLVPLCRVSGPTRSDLLWFFAAHLSKRDKKKTCSNLLRYQKYQTIPLGTSQQESANGSWNSSIFKSQVWETLITCHSTVPPPQKKRKKLLIEMANLIEMWLRCYINLDVLNLTSAESLCTQATFFYLVLKLPSVSLSADLWKEQLYFGVWCRATGSWL